VTWASTQFLGNAFVVVMAVVIFPLTPANMAVRCFRLSLLGSVVASILSLVATYGTPTVLRWDAIKLWLQRCSSGPEILTILHCAAFLPAPKPAVLAALPVACHIAPAVAEHLQQQLAAAAQLYQSYLEKACTWLISKQDSSEPVRCQHGDLPGLPCHLLPLHTAEEYSSSSSTGRSCVSSITLLPPPGTTSRSGLQLGRQVVPFIQQYAPFCSGPLEYAKKWFTQVGQ